MSWRIAFREFRKVTKGRGFIRSVHTSKDPTLITVLLEDSAALIGLLIALAGVAFGHWFENPYLDGSASIAIGILLAAVAGVLAYESKGLLVGEGVHPRKLEAIRTLIGADPSVEDVVRVLTMHFGPQEILLNLDIRFREDLSVPEVTEAIDGIEQKICRSHPDVNRISIEIESLSPKGRAGQRELYASGT